MAKVGRFVHNIDNTDTTNTNYDATISGFGDVTAFVTHVSGYDDFYGSGDSTAMSVFGLRNSSGNFDVYSVAFNIRHGIGTADTHRSWNYSDTNVAYFREVCELQFSPITNGIRITLTGTASSVYDRYMTAHTTAFSGVKAARQVITGTGQYSWTVADHQSSTSFTPGAVFAHSAGHDVFNGGNETTDIAAYSFGFATPNNQWALGYTDSDAAANQRANVRLDTSSTLLQVYNDSTQFTDSTAYWSSTGLVINRGLATREAVYMALDDSIQFSSGVGSSSTSSGNVSYGTATTNTPVVADVYATNVTSTSLFTSNPGVSGFMYGHLAESGASSTGAALAGHADYVGGDNITTMIAEMYTGSNFQRRKYTGTTFGTSWSGTPSFTTGKQLQIGYSTVDGTARDLAYIDYAAPVTSTDFAVDSGTFTLTGNAASLGTNINMSAGSGSFSVSGSATFSIGTNLQASSGSFVVSGSAGFAIDLGVGSGLFALTGNAVSTLISVPIRANSGSFLLTGNDATLQAQVSVDFAVNAGSYAVTGQDVFYGVTLGAAAGSFQVAGGFTDLTDTGSILKSPYYYRILMQE